MEYLKHLLYVTRDKILDYLHIAKQITIDIFYFVKDKTSTFSPGVRRILFISVALLLALLLFFGIKKIFFKKKANDNNSDAFQVKVAKVKKDNFTESYTVMGSIKGIIENELRFEIDGVLNTFNYKEGAHITKGKVICSLDTKDAFTKCDFAKSKYTSERASYYSASQRLKVYEDLFKMKAISESKLEEARYETQSAESRMKAAYSEFELAQLNLAKTNLVAPSDGLLAEILIKQGEYITPQDVVAKFIMGGDTFFEVDVPEKDVANLKVDLNAKINCDSYPGKDFFGKIAEISPIVDTRTRTRKVRISLANQENMLRSGMFGRGTIYLVELTNVVLVPTDSVVTLNETTSLVPIVKPDPKLPGEGTIEMRQVKTGQKLTSKTVIDDGLFPDELVVVETQGQLADGIRVKFQEIVTDNKNGEAGPPDQSAPQSGAQMGGSPLGAQPQ